MKTKLKNHLNFNEDNYTKYLESLTQEELKELDKLETCLYYQVYYDCQHFKEKLFRLHNYMFRENNEHVVIETLEKDLNEIKELIHSYKDNPIDNSYEHDYLGVDVIVEDDDKTYSKEAYEDLLNLKFFDNYNFIDADCLIKEMKYLSDILELTIKLYKEFFIEQHYGKEYNFKYYLIGFNKELFVRFDEGHSMFLITLNKFINNYIISIEHNLFNI